MLHAPVTNELRVAIGLLQAKSQTKRVCGKNLKVAIQSKTLKD